MIDRWIPFEPLRATQAAAYVLRLSEGAYDYDLLVKALYIADWEALQVTQRAMTGVLFKLGFEEEIWNRHIGREGGTAILLADPGDGELSEFDEETLSKVWLGMEAAGRDEFSQHEAALDKLLDSK